MGENSKIEWTDHTWNPWIGCTKVHAGCTHCYAEAMMDHRYGKAKWGPNGTRNRTSYANWKKPIIWNRDAERAGRPALVFCASLADVFEDREDLVQHRSDLFALIDRTPNLIWLMLTKRPENVRRMWIPRDTISHEQGFAFQDRVNRRPNVWIGTSPCNQETADKAIPELLKASDICGGLFLSCEPLVGPLSFRWAKWQPFSETGHTDHLDGLRRFGWVIVGGESGHDFRPMPPVWVESIIDECREAEVPVFVKQMAGKGPIPPGLQVRQFPAAFQRTSELAAN